jgi:hypothetical protein
MTDGWTTATTTKTTTLLHYYYYSAAATIAFTHCSHRWSCAIECDEGVVGGSIIKSKLRDAIYFNKSGERWVSKCVMAGTQEPRYFFHVTIRRVCGCRCRRHLRLFYIQDDEGALSRLAECPEMMSSVILSASIEPHTNNR